MIKLTLFNDSDVIVNADLIESVERTPDTLISLTTGKKVMVKESVQDVIDKVIAFRREIGKSGPPVVGIESRTTTETKGQQGWT